MDIIIFSMNHDNELMFLSQNNVNIKNIKICPCALNESLRIVYVECDHNLEMGVIEQLENEQLGLPGTLKVFIPPEPTTIEKNEGLYNNNYYVILAIIHWNLQYSYNIVIDANSKRVKEIVEVLKHEPGALCSFLDIVRETEVSLIIVQLF